MNFTKFEKRANPLLERTEISAIFDIENTSFNRREASTLIAKEAKINPDTVYSIKLSNSAGSHFFIVVIIRTRGSTHPNSLANVSAAATAIAEPKIGSIASHDWL